MHLSRITAPVINSGLGLMSRLLTPQIHGKLRIQGLNSPVEIYKDKWGVPHIFAKDIHDLLFAQGYIHAQERLWQMEFNRRLTAGRLSEIFGSNTVQVDRWMRILTMRRVAETEVGLLNEETISYLNAYINGINHFIQLGRLPIEFILLRHKPDPWEIADSLTWIKMMAWGLSVNWEMELLRARLVKYFGPQKASELEPPHLGRWPFVIPPEIDYSRVDERDEQLDHQSRLFLSTSPYEGLGSNNWVVSGELTSTGMPLLANDMHLPMGIPSIWFENHLVCNEFNTIGVTFPGIPGVISGHNGYVAWGYTNGFPDVQDLYVERLRRLDDGRVQAEYCGTWEDVCVFREIIHVKGGNSAQEEVIVTRHGPIINSIVTKESIEYPLALRWTALDPDTMIQGIFNMLRARNCEQFHKSLQDWTTPVQNVVHADVEGNIAYSFPGKIPTRANGDGRLPVPGWTDEYEWLGYISFEKLPYLFNPPQGYVASANNRVFEDQSAYPIIVEPISGDRAQRIVELLNDHFNRNEKIDIDYIIRMQFDLISPSAREIIRLFNRIELSNEHSQEVKDVIQMMKSWNGELGIYSKEAVIYQAFIRQLIHSILADRISELNEDIDHSLIKRFMGEGINPILADAGMMGELWLPWLTYILNSTNQSWIDRGYGRNRDDFFVNSIKAALQDLRGILGPNIDSWSWGKLHQLSFTHVLSSNSLLESFFNRGPFVTGGDQTTIWATGSSYHELSGKRFVGPPYRMIVDLGDLRNSISILTPGQSGNPTSRHYDDQIISWYNAEYHPMLIERSEIKKLSSSKLQLVPK